MQLETPARYFPITRGLYEVVPGLKRLGSDFGNGAMDHRVFQLDADFPRFRQNKLNCRREPIEKYLQQSDVSPQADRALVEWLIHRLTTEYPHVFTLDGNRIHCRHTDETITLNENQELVHHQSNAAVQYRSALDALANQVAEDICLTRLEGFRNWLAAAHVCSPGHWSPQEKIGRSFTDIHRPIPGIEKINEKSGHFVELMIHRGPFVRFAWGFGTDDRLNHHPEPPVGVDPDQWRGRVFDPQEPSFFLRVERQVIWGLPAVNAAAFVIRVSHIPGDQIRSNPDQREQLIAALKSMTPEAQRYKGVAGSVDAILKWLRGPWM
jgi:hypothetical protein